MHMNHASRDESSKGQFGLLVVQVTYQQSVCCLQQIPVCSFKCTLYLEHFPCFILLPDSLGHPCFICQILLSPIQPNSVGDSNFPSRNTGVACLFVLLCDFSVLGQWQFSDSFVLRGEIPDFIYGVWLVWRERERERERFSFVVYLSESLSLSS